MSVFPPILNGTLRGHDLLFFGAAGALSMVVGMTGAWLGARFGMRRALREMRQAQLITGGENAARFHELTQSLEDVALEVERIAERQRFTARVLTERGSAGGPLPSARRGSVTPH